MLPLFLGILLLALAACASTTEPAQQVPEPAGFACTQVMGYSQVGQQGGGWYVAGGVFESIVGNDRWQLLWHGGAGVDRWQDADYRGWSNALVSACRNSAAAPDRVLLSVSGPYGADEQAWAAAIEASIATIRQKLPSARVIMLQAVVGGPGGATCPCVNNCRQGNRVRASWQHRHIVNAIEVVADRYSQAGVTVLAGYAPQVRTCADYQDGLGHLTPGGAAAAARAIAEYYAREQPN